jgi:hypothetical protein
MPLLQFLLAMSLTAVALPTTRAEATVDDPILARVERAEAEYDRETKRARDVLLAHMDKEVTADRNSNQVDRLERATVERRRSSRMDSCRSASVRRRMSETRRRRGGGYSAPTPGPSKTTARPEAMRRWTPSGGGWGNFSARSTPWPTLRRRPTIRSLRGASGVVH